MYVAFKAGNVYSLAPYRKARPSFDQVFCGTWRCLRVDLVMLLAAEKLKMLSTE